MRPLQVSEAARELGVSEAWLRRTGNSGRIPKARRDLNGWRVYTPEDITKLRELIVGGVNPTEAP
jgi:DNA-binding transcriptional MerR regulator